MKNFINNISIKFRVLVSYVIIIIIFAGIGISQYNVLIKINDIKHEKKILTEAKNNFKEIKYLLAKETQILYQIQNSEANNELNLIKTEHKKNNELLNNHILETKQILNINTNNQKFNLFTKQLEDSLSVYEKKYNEYILFSLDQVIRYKELLNEPSKINDNIKQLVEEQSKINVSYNIYEANSQVSIQTVVNNLIEIYIDEIERHSEFIEKSAINNTNSLTQLEYNFEDFFLNDYFSITKISDKSITRSWIIFFIGLIISIISSLLLSQSIIKPLNELNELTNKIGRGELPDENLSISKSEIGEMNISIKSLLVGLKQTSQFAYQIGKGNFKHKYTPLSEKDVLGNSLLEMRESLQLAQKEEKKRQIEDQHRNWTSEGLAKFAEILRLYPDNLKELSNQIISNLVKYMNANQGSIFILNDTIKDDVYLELLASYAYNRKKFQYKKIRLGEGLVGSVAIEKFSIYMTDIPNEYIQIESGTGSANPNSILIVPLKIDEQVLGVIELASFFEFKNFEQDLVEQIAESIASTLSTARINTQTARLLEKSQKQAFEMKEQEDKMKITIEQLKQTQEDAIQNEENLNDTLSTLKINYNKLEENKSKLVNDISLQKNIIIEKEQLISNHINYEQTIIQNAIDGIIIINKNGGIEYVNNSIEKIWQYKDNELIGTNINLLFNIRNEDKNKQFVDTLISDFFIKDKSNRIKYEIIKKDKSITQYIISFFENQFQKNKYTILIKDIAAVELLENIETKEVEDISSREFEYITWIEQLTSKLNDNDIPLPNEKYPKNLIKWNTSFEIGMQLIDKQHKKMIELVNKLYIKHLKNDGSEEFINIFSEMINYFGYNFGFEEKYMSDAKYENFIKHKKMHDKFISTIKKYLKEYRAGNKDIPLKLFVYIKKWLFNHIKIEDSNYVESFKNHGLI